MNYFKTLFVRLQMSKEQGSVLKQELKPNDINNFNPGRRSNILPSRGCFSNLWNKLDDWSEGSRIIEFQVMAVLILILNSSSTYFTDPH